MGGERGRWRERDGQSEWTGAVHCMHWYGPSCFPLPLVSI